MSSVGIKGSRENAGEPVFSVISTTPRIRHLLKVISVISTTPRITHWLKVISVISTTS